jgi:hypothetical protein
MPRKLFLRLDRASLHADDRTAIAGCDSVAHVDEPEDCFQYSFDPTHLDHALLLLGENKSRFGFDLWHYLYSAQGFFGQTNDGFVLMPDSTPDFKRRFSEDLGVAIGSMFLVDTLSLKWETICQIPINRKLDKHGKTPDFIGFDTTGRKRVYECKGTTAPHDVDKHRQKAKSQLAEHKEANVTKFAMVTYVPTSARLIPPYLFVSDPPILLPTLTERLAAGLHYLLAFQFAGLDGIIEPLRSALALRYKIDASEAVGDVATWQDEQDLATQNSQLVAAANALSQQSGLVAFQGQQFAGTWREAEDQKRKLRAFTGVSTSHVIELASAVCAAPDPQRPFNTPSFSSLRTANADDQHFSLFSEGTLLLIEPSAAEAERK